MVVNAEAAASVDGLQEDAIAPESRNKLADALHCRAEGVCGADLRADVDAYAAGFEPAMFCDAFVDAGRLADVDAELVFTEAGRDIGMGIGEDVRVHTQGEAGFRFELGRAGGEQRQLGFALDVELKNSGLEGEIDLRGGFANAGEDDAVDCFRRGGGKIRSSSPPETMSKPAPWAASSLRTARAELALTA